MLETTVSGKLCTYSQDPIIILYSHFRVGIFLNSEYPAVGMHKRSKGTHTSPELPWAFRGLPQHPLPPMYPSQPAQGAPSHVNLSPSRAHLARHSLRAAYRSTSRATRAQARTPTPPAPELASLERRHRCRSKSCAQGPGQSSGEDCEVKGMCVLQGAERARDVHVRAAHKSNTWTVVVAPRSDNGLGSPTRYSLAGWPGALLLSHLPGRHKSDTYLLEAQQWRVQQWLRPKLAPTCA